MKTRRPVRVLYSFPHRLGADRICYTAWQQVNGLAAAGADVHVMAASFERTTPPDVKLSPTLSRGRLRLPYSLIGSRRAFALHDYIVSKRLEALAATIDVVHTWPLGALRTLSTAQRLGIPTVMERPNAHTRFAYEAVRAECERIGVALPPGHEHAYNEDILSIEEEEYARAYRLLCPSDFVVKTFQDKGIGSEKLLRHFYGFDETVYKPSARRANAAGLKVLFVGVCAVRKGVHLALEAWLASPAHREGKFVIAGEFLPAYQAKLAPMLSHPSVQVLGHRRDIPQLMQQSDILVLPSIEEGFGLVCTEAMGSGCVPLVSDACTDLCRHMDNALVHRTGDVQALTDHFSLLHSNRSLLHSLRQAGLNLVPSITWTAAGVRLLDAYTELLYAHSTEQVADATKDGCVGRQGLSSSSIGL
jgi:glycosyltransferase involved in cell wall biosynthesis